MQFIGSVEATTTATVTFSNNDVAFEADMNHDGIPDAYIQSVRPLGSEFLVNTLTTNPQAPPTIGMNLGGDFTIAWATEGQNLSYFNSIEAQIYDRDGNRVGSEFRVNSVENTTVNFAPAVAMSDDGVIAITWTNTADPNYYLTNALAGAIEAKVYNGQGTVLLDEFNVGGGGSPASPSTRATTSSSAGRPGPMRTTPAAARKACGPRSTSSTTPTTTSAARSSVPRSASIARAPIRVQMRTGPTFKATLRWPWTPTAI